MSEYTEQAEKFLRDTGTSFKAEHIACEPYFDDDKESRDTSMVTISINIHNLRTNVRWCVKRGYLTFNPIEGVSIPSGQKVGRKLASRASKQRFVEKCS